MAKSYKLGTLKGLIIFFVIVLIGLMAGLAYLIKQDQQANQPQPFDPNQTLSQSQTANQTTNEVQNPTGQEEPEYEEKENDTQEMVLKYAYGYNMETLKAILSVDKDYLDVLEIKVKGKDLEEVKNLLDKEDFKEVKLQDEFDVIVYGSCELVIDENRFLVFDPGNEYAYLYEEDALEAGDESNFYLTQVSEKLVEKLNSVLEKERVKELQGFQSTKITITDEQNDSEDLVITEDAEIKEMIEHLSYGKLTTKEDLSEGEDLIYTVDFNNGTKIQVYYASAVGHLENEEDNCYIVFDSGFEDYVEDIYKNNESGVLELLDTDEILLHYEGRNYNIIDEENLNYVIGNLKKCTYRDYPYLENMDFSKLTDDEYIILEVGKCTFYISTLEGYGSRFVDADGTKYDVGNLADSELEETIKNWVKQ
ncbi:MAG: hypothetical protein IJ629_03355 [Clostridia bacterium]|nr:hypothetical protein [Clostridia bacterium]